MTKRTVREFFHALNVLEEDRDVYVDGFGVRAVCPPVRLTENGKQRFAGVLDNEELYVEDGTICSTNNDDYEDWNAGHLSEAYFLLTALAGYVSCSDYDNWFENGDEL